MNRFFTLLLTASCLTAVGQVPDYLPTEGLVAWYPFTGDAADFSGNGHHGTVDGAGSAPDRNGLLDQSLFFDGVNDGVFIPHHDDFLTADQTVTFWINIGASELIDTPGASNSMGLVNKTNQETSNTQNRFFAINLGGVGEPSYEPYKVTLAASTGQSVNPGSSVESASTDTIIYSNHWFFIAATMTENSLEIYVDGELVASSVLLYSRFPNTADIKIGVDYTFDPNRYFNGRLDDVGFWNRALSSEEILGLYLAPPPVMGCMDPEACNFDPEANFENGSCHFICQYCLTGTVWSEELGGCVPHNPSDLNHDGCVDVNDFMGHLAAFGAGCDSNTQTSSWQCGDPLGYQGYDYETVQIGEQCWFAENLRVDKNRLGEQIPQYLNCESWANASGPGFCLYGNDSELELVHGKLYNWFTTNSSFGVCPNEWHVPTDDEWMTLELELGMSESQVSETNWRGTVEGDLLKSEYLWNGSDAFGFNAFPSGWRYPFNGCDFVSQNSTTFYWTSSENDNKAIGRELTSSETRIARMTSYQLLNGFSIRCIKD